MITVHDGFLNASEVAHMARLGAAELGPAVRPPWPGVQGGRPTPRGSAQLLTEIVYQITSGLSLAHGLGQPLVHFVLASWKFLISLGTGAAVGFS